MQNPIKRCAIPVPDQETSLRRLRSHGINLDEIRTIMEMPDGSLIVTMHAGEEEWQLEINGRSDLALVLTIASKALNIGTA